MANNQGVDPRISDLDLRPREATKDTALLGKTRRLNDLTCLEIVFVIFSVLGLIACFVLTVIKVIGYTGDDFTFAILIIVNTAVCFYYIFDGIFRERPYELAIFVIATTIVVVYVIVNFADTEGWHDTVKLIRFIFAIVFAPFLVIVGCIITRDYNESGNLIFRTVGASAELQSCCKIMFFTSSIIKLDFQIAMSMIVLVLRNGRIIGQLETITLAVGIPVTVLWLILGFWCMRFENKIATWIFWLTGWMEPAYVIYKIVQEVLPPPEQSPTQTPHESQALTAVTYTCAAIALIIRIAVVILMILVYRNYGKGLKEKMGKSSQPVKRNVEDSAVASNQV
ncbi:uncharacterized protein LOC135496872 isoform X2 [Lineus longissimus]|uniref:uncharacterized protein LOC135496872 isoform X2 n=1 Tax=Lineus longissimus TaxID=88925 RepID=UPI002B4EE731